ncbi:MAG: hypothetical protein KatS3mg131_1992 [Candidatus Tectimicrobiota bacterium]|nr:MAG: hypothetical protein KatS3mg131_1992 [Candidatus Tectomicrobia bacterium]
MGKFTLEIQGEKSVLQQLAALLLFLEQWGHLGAKPQLGYGILQILNREEVRGWARGMSWNVGSNAPTPNENLPDLRRFGFFRYRFSPQGDWWTHVPGLNADGTKERVQQLLSHYNTVPVSPALKNEWRFQRWKGKRQDEQWMFGTTRWRRNRETVRVRSKIVVSWAYKLDREWEIRGWAWLQKPAIAADVWELLKDEAGWQSVLSLQGKLQGEPSGNWTERSGPNKSEICFTGSHHNGVGVYSLAAP